MKRFLERKKIDSGAAAAAAEKFMELILRAEFIWNFSPPPALSLSLLLF
jgi:hypothetical protein